MSVVPNRKPMLEPFIPPPGQIAVFYHDPLHPSEKGLLSMHVAYDHQFRGSMWQAADRAIEIR
jgi:hypothetical protein